MLLPMEAPFIRSCGTMARDRRKFDKDVLIETQISFHAVAYLS